MVDITVFNSFKLCERWGYRRYESSGTLEGSSLFLNFNFHYQFVNTDDKTVAKVMHLAN